MKMERKEKVVRPPKPSSSVEFTETEEQKKKRLRIREQAVNELISTEKTYLGDLDILISVSIENHSLFFSVSSNFFIQRLTRPPFFFPFFFPLT